MPATFTTKAPAMAPLNPAAGVNANGKAAFYLDGIEVLVIGPTGRIARQELSQYDADYLSARGVQLDPSNCVYMDSVEGFNKRGDRLPRN